MTNRLPLGCKLQLRANLVLRATFSTCYLSSIFHPRLEYSRNSWHLATCLQPPPQMLATSSASTNSCIQTGSSLLKKIVLQRVKTIVIVAFVCFHAETHNPNVPMNEAHSLRGAWNPVESHWEAVHFAYSCTVSKGSKCCISIPPHRCRREMLIIFQK